MEKRPDLSDDHFNCGALYLCNEMKHAFAKEMGFDRPYGRSEEKNNSQVNSFLVPVQVGLGRRC